MALRFVRSALVGSLVLAGSLMACGGDDAPAGDTQPAAGKSGGAGASASGGKSGSAGVSGGSGASGSSLAGGGGVAGSAGAAAGNGGAAGGNGGSAGNGGASAGNGGTSAGSGGTSAGSGGGTSAGNGGTSAGNGGMSAGSGGETSAGSGGGAEAGSGGSAGAGVCRAPDGCALGAPIEEAHFAVGSSSFGLVNGKVCPGGPSGPEGRCLVEYDLGKIALVVDADRLGAQGELPVRVTNLPVRINVALGVRTTRMTYNEAASCQTTGLPSAKAKVKLTFSQPLPEGEALVLGCSPLAAPTIAITIDDPPVVGCDTVCEPSTACAPTDNVAPAMVKVARTAIQDTLRDALLASIAMKACTTP